MEGTAAFSHSASFIALSIAKTADIQADDMKDTNETRVHITQCVAASTKLLEMNPPQSKLHCQRTEDSAVTLHFGPKRRTPARHRALPYADATGSALKPRIVAAPGEQQYDSLSPASAPTSFYAAWCAIWRQGAKPLPPHVVGCCM